MCIAALPSNTLASQIFKSGISGKVRDAVFGKGTSQKIVNRVDRAFKNTTPEFLINEGIGVQPGSFFGQTSGDFDFEGDRIAGIEAADAKKRASELRRQTRLLPENQGSSFLAGG